MKAKFYHSLLFLAIVSLVGLSSCEKDFPEFDFENNQTEITTRDQADNGAPVTYGFWAGQHIDVGSLVVSNDEDNIYVTFNTSGNWWLQVTHLHISTTLQGIPSNKKGTPVPGQFEYQTIHNPRVQTYTYSVPNTWAEGEDLVIAAHAEVVLLDENGNVIQEETGFGGDNAGTGPRWWFWAGYSVANDNTGNTGGDTGEIGGDGDDDGDGDGDSDGDGDGDGEGDGDGDGDGEGEGEGEGDGDGDGDGDGEGEGDGGDDGDDEGGAITPPTQGYAWVTDTLASPTTGSIPSEEIDGRIFVAVSGFSDDAGEPNGFGKAIVDENGAKIGEMTIYYPYAENLKSGTVWARSSSAAKNDAEPFWYIKITMFDGYSLDTAGFYFVSIGDDSNPAINLPNAVNFPGDYFTRKPAEGSNTYTLYLNDDALSNIDFTYGFYVSSFVEYTSTGNSTEKFVSRKN